MQYMKSIHGIYLIKALQAGINKLKNIAVGFVKEEAAWKRLYGV